MRSNIKLQNRRLLEALYYIDEEVLADVLADITVPEPSAPLPRKKAVIRSIKYAALLAACALLVGAVFPIVSYIMGIIDLNPGSITTSESTDSSEVIRTGYQVFGDEIYFLDTGRLTRYLPETGELRDLSGKTEEVPGKEVKCLSQIADGKLYYIYEDTSTVYEDTSLIYMDPSIPTNGHNSYVAVFDLLTMQSVDLCEISYHYTIGKGYVYGDYYYYYRSINIVKPRGQLCRIPLLDGEEEVVKDFEGEEELFMIADGEIITINTSSEVSADTVTEISVIKSYNIETGNERILWNGEIAKYESAINPSYLDGKLYFLASGSQGNDLIAVDVKSGRSKILISGIASYWLMNNGIYYYPFELREVNYRSPFAAEPSNYETHESSILRYCRLNGKNDREVYSNSDITAFYPAEQIIACGKMIGDFCGSFPELGMESGRAWVEIDLESGDVKDVRPTGYDYVITEEDLEQINVAWRTTYPSKAKNFRRFSDVETAMRRSVGTHYYFGKYGNTFIILEYRSKRCNFSLCGYDFDFCSGRVWFINGNRWYENANVPADLLTTEEAKAFYDAFTEHYLPLITYEYDILSFTPDIEMLEEDEMKRVNEAYEKWYVEKRYESTQDYDKAYESTYGSIGYHPHRFFLSSKFDEYHYYGKIGGKIFIAKGRDTNIAFTTTEIAGYKFVLGGYDSLPLVYSDGIVTELSAAYENGLVSKQEVAKVHERHMAYYNYYFDDGRKEEPIPDELKIADNSAKPSPIELTDTEKREIVWEYIENDNDLKYTFGVRCYGKFEGGTYAVMIDGPYMYFQVVETEDIAGYRFTFPNSQPMYIYKDGVFYRLAEAYARDIISKEDVAAIQWSKTPIAD